MESMLGFEETLVSCDDNETLSSSSSSNGYKLVPWLNWEEWDSVRESLFSSTDKSRVAFALDRISTWRGRGCLPVVIDVTASIIEIQLKDPYYRDQDKQQTDVIVSEQLLAMLYCMAILRLVNCVVEKTRRKTEISIAEAATVIGIPRNLIDVRHEGSHRDLPALQVVRDCSDKALHWLKAYYWDPQKKQIPLQRDGIADVRRDIRSKLQELTFCLKVMHNPQLGSSLIKGKRGKYYEGLCGRNKFMSIMAGKHHSSKTRVSGSKKKMTKCLKALVELYSSFSKEIVSVLLDFLLEALDSSNLEFQNNSGFIQNKHLSLDDLKPVITRFSIKEPELLLTLLQAVLDLIRSEEANQYETERQNMTSSEYKMGTRRIEHLTYLFAWLVGLLRGLKPLQSTDSAAGNNISNKILVKLLRKCLLVATGNKMLMDSALQVAQLLGNTSLVEKLNKLSSIYLSHADDSEEISSLPSSENLLRQEDFILQAAKKLELVKHQRMESKVVKTADGNVGTSNRWVVAKSWNSCPIGMLPRDLGSSGRLPVLDYENSKQRGHEQSERKETWELIRCTGKREATCNIQLVDNSSVKKMKNTVDADNEEVSLFEEGKGHLMVGGVWKKVGDEELQSIKSGIRILV